MVRARKQHEEDLALIGAGTDWDCHRRTYAQEEVWTPWNPREMRILLTDEERVALGGIFIGPVKTSLLVKIASS